MKNVLLPFLCLFCVNMIAQSVQTPKAPTLKYSGAKGNKSACYWIAAENKQGELTNLSEPAMISGLPDQLTKENSVTIEIAPETGAEKYHIYKTELLAKPENVQVKVRNSPLLIIGDFKNILPFIFDLKTVSQNKPKSAFAFVWNKLTPGLQKKLIAFPRGGIPGHLDDGSQMSKLLSSLISELNQQLQDKTFSESIRDYHKFSDKTTKKKEAAEPTAETDYITENRILFDECFAKYITPWIGKAERKNFYYWIAAKNMHRWSDLAGPFSAENVDISKGVLLQWSPVANATFYEVYRTETPAKPLGRRCHLLAHQYEKNNLKDTAQSCAMGVAGYKATPATAPPVGACRALLSVSNQLVVEDSGQKLHTTTLPNVNATLKAAIHGNSQHRPNAVKQGDDVTINSLMTEADRVGTLKFGPGSHRSALTINQHLKAGGLSERQDPPYGYGGGKSSTYAIKCQSESETSSQHHGISMEMRNFGTGDAMPVCITMKSFGSGNKDGGDEGQHLRRETFIRHPHQAYFTLAGNASKGSTDLQVTDRRNNIWGQAGTGRMLINLSKQYNKGRIEYVKDVTVIGKDTNWTDTMTGQFISFDIDTFTGQQADTKSPRRLFYQIVKVISPECLEIRALSGWSTSCNLGLSRYIYDAETKKGPGILYNPEKGGYLPNPLPEQTDYSWDLPNDKKAIAGKGSYIIAPGTYLADPWFKNPLTICVEPISEDWQKGDKLLIPMSPGIFRLARTMYYRGDFCPQDAVYGVIIANANPQTIPSPAISVGQAPQWGGFREGIRILLPSSGQGDGLRIRGNRVKTASIRVPSDLPAIRFDNSNTGVADIPYLQGNSKTNELDFIYPNKKKNRTVFSISQDSVCLNNSFIKGSSRTRGKAVFSGDGKRKAFKVKFGTKYPDVDPFVTFSTNCFERSRLAEITQWHFIVEFETPPKENSNITIYWHAQL